MRVYIIPQASIPNKNDIIHFHKTGNRCNDIGLSQVERKDIDLRSDNRSCKSGMLDVDFVSRNGRFVMEHECTFNFVLLWK